MELLEKKHQEVVKGFIFNKFRGDKTILKPGISKIKKITNLPVLGIIPKIEVTLPEEDSLNSKPKNYSWTKKRILKINNELDDLARIVKSNIDIKSIEKMLK